MVIGVVANIFLSALGYDIGKPSLQLIHQLRYEKEIEKAKGLLSEFRDKILIPDWVAVREDGGRVEYPVDAIPADMPVMDIGTDSMIHFSRILKEAGTVVFNGPAGVFEEKDFATGTYELLKSASEAEFSVVGGGHTAAVIEKIGIEDRFTHISTGGGACIEFLTGKVLPAVDALEKSKILYG